jgi:sugar phosphate isomerase/epimerase
MKSNAPADFRSDGRNNDVDGLSRRRFLATTASVAVPCLAATVASAAEPASSEQTRKAMPSRGGALKVGLYSITFLGLWYRGKELPLEEVVRRAKQYGYDGMEIDGKRPHGNPLDWPASKCRELRRVADGEGIDIYSVAAHNDFSSPICEHRESEMAYVRELARMTSDLGAKTLRIFFAWCGVTRHPQLGRYDISRQLWKAEHESCSPEDTWAWCREGMVEAAKYAGDYGITLALQNHQPVIKDHRDVLRMVREVDSPNLKVCLDASIMPDKRPEVVRQAALDVGPLQILSHFGGEFDRDTDGVARPIDPASGKAVVHEFDPAFVRAMREIGYRGYIGYELCHPLPVVNGETVGVEYAEKNAQLACEYMRGLIKSA